MSESANSAKSAKQIFANFVKFVKFVKPIFGTTRRSEGSVTEAEYPTNYQRISNLLLTIRPFRVAILAVLLVFVGGWNTQAWGGTATLTLRAIANSSKGGYVMVSDNSNASFSGTATDQSKDKTGDTGWTGLSSKKLTLYAYASAKAGCVFLGWAESETGSIVSKDTKISYTTGNLYYSMTDSKTYYAIFARMVANTPAAESTISFDDTNVEDESGWKQIKIDHAHAGTVTLTQTGNDGDFYVASGTTATSEFSSFSSTTEGTKTIYVKFVPQSQSIGPRSCTLTVSSSNNDLSSLTYYLSGTGYKVQAFEWNGNNGLPLTSGETTLGIGDTLRATCSSGQVVSYSGYNTSYFTATTDAQGQNVLVVKESISGNIQNQSVTANVLKSTNYYNDHSETFTLNLTNLTPQTIEWTNDISDISDEEIGHTITLNAVAKNAKTGANSGQTITYSMAANDYLSLSGNVLTVKAIGGPVAITATAAENANYAPTSVTKYATVIDMSHPCATSDSYNGKTLNKDNKSLVIYPTLPGKLTFNLKRSTNLFVLNKFTVKEYNSNNSLLATTEYDNSSISTSGETKTINCNVNATKIEFYCDAYLYYSCTVSNVSTTRVTSSSVSVNTLSYATDPGQSLGKQVSVSYSNIPVFLSFKSDEDAGVKGTSLWSLSTSKFGGCGKKGSQNVTVTFQSNTKGNFTDKLYVRNNVGTLLHTIDLSASVTAQEQFLKSWNIEDVYNTTDQVTLQASTTVDNTDFTFTATTSNPANIVSISNAGVMTFSGSGTATIRAYQPGDAMSQEFVATHTITISKVTPELTAPTSGTEIQYLQTLDNSTIANDGVAKVTLRGVENTVVAGTWAWTNPTQIIKDNADTHTYEVKFTPTDGGMYTTNTCMVPVTILRAPQTIAMNNGAVKVAVDGIDEGKTDSYLNLNSLIATQTTDVVNAVKRDGNVTYAVISANADKATIDGSTFSATEIGDYTIRATKAETDYYNEVTDEFVVSVSKRANTMTISNTTFERFVEEEVTNVRDAQNSDAEVQTSSDFPTIAYYDVANNKIVIPNSESDEQMFGAYKTVTIKIWQEATDRFEACEKTITLGVKKYVTTSNGEDYIIKVNETKTANYGFTNTSASYPSNNLTDDFYYTIDEPNFENAALNNGTELITYDPATNEITGHNAGTTKITFFQKETYKYTGATLMCNISVEKRENQIANSWSNTWQKAMSENGVENISFTSTHGDYANYPISIEQIYGADVATLTGDASGASITTNTTKGYAIWHLYQEENYEYGSAEADVMVLVGVPAPPTCYVYQDATEHKFSTSVWDAEGHFETPIAINAPVDKIWFKAKRQWGGVNYFTVQYSKDNGINWKTLSSPSLDDEYKSEPFVATFPTMQGTERITHVRFGAATGATLSKWYKDVQISRKAYLNIQDAEKKKISKLPTMMCTIDETSSAEAKFYIDYSTCADEIIIESSNPEHFTVSRETINVSDKHDNLTSAKEEITVTYSSTELGTHNAVITIRTSYQACALSVSGETTKRTPTLTWQEGYTNNPLTLPIGLTVNAIKPAATTTSTALIKYESNDESVVRILDNGYAFQVVGLGSAILTAIVPENEKWKSVSDTRVIQATEKVVQEIVWNQTFPRFMEPGDVIDLDAKVFLRNLSTGELTYSEERSQYISYSCPLNNGIVSVSGNQMTILNYGEVKVTASVSGNADYEAAAPVIVLINVRQPSAGCATPFVLNKEDVIDMYEVDVDFSDYTHLTTEEMISDDIDLDPTQGKPDKLSFRYYGEEYKLGLIKSFGGFVKFEQRVNSQWLPVENSRVETVKNEWKTNSDLQLDERADALRIIRESGATGHHKIKDIQVTRKQYLRATQNEINLGEVTLGQATPVIVGFDYSDVKGDLTAHTINSTTDVTIKDNGIIDLQCGGFGHYNLQVTFTPTQLGEWQGAIEVYDNIANLSITVQLSATVNANEEYIFNKEGNWNTNTNWTTNLVPDENVDITVAKNMTISSAANVHSIAIEKDVTVTVKSGATLVIGNGTPKSLESYGNLHVENGGNVILNDGASLILNDVILDAQLGMTDEQTTSASCSGQITNESQLVVNGDAYFRLKLDPSGQNTLGWYDFVVPFPVDVIGGISIAEDPSAVMQFNVNYAVMNYDEAKNAQRGKHWNKFTGTMLPGRAYTITLDETKPWNTVVFKKKAGEAVTGDRSFTTEYSGLGATKDNGWNGFGNGTLHHTELDVAPGTLIQLYDHAHRCYQPREAKGYSIAVGLSFFMQFGGVETVTLLSADDENTNFRAPERAISNVEKFRLALTAEDAINPADYIWVSASEEATDEYVIGRDVLKMGSMNESTVARMWTTRAGMGLCSNEMPLVDNIAQCALGLYAPQARTYTIAVEEAPQDANLYLTYNDQVIWDLTLGAYTIDLAKGKNTGYGLRIEARAPQIATGVENAAVDSKSARKVMINNTLYVVTPEGAMYDVLGKGVKF